MNNQTGTGERTSPMLLRNDTVVNVAQLMKADVGASRWVTVDLDWMGLDDDLMAKNVHAELRMTRITRGILASGQVTGTGILECVRCLELYDQPFTAQFDEEYRPTIDVRSGLAVDQPAPDEEFGTIDDAHELNLAEPMRQVAILSLPIRPVCGDDCPGIEQETAEDDAAEASGFGVLRDLLGPDADDETTDTRNK